MNSRAEQNRDLFQNHVAVLAVCWVALNFALLSILGTSSVPIEFQAIHPSIRRKFKPIEIHHGQFQARLMRPKHEKELLPLVVFLHGAGERGNDNWQQLQHFAPQVSTYQNRKFFPCYVFAPQCPENYNWNDCLLGLHESIQHLIQSEKIDPDRIYLTGLSMGGFGTWNLASQSPELFAAIAPVCGGGDPEQAGKISHIPTWVVHGAEDKAVPIHHSQQMVEAVQNSGGNPIFTQLPNTGHNSWNWLYNNPNFLKWLFEQHRRPKISPK